MRKTILSKKICSIVLAGVMALSPVMPAVANTAVVKAAETASYTNLLGEWNVESQDRPLTEIEKGVWQVEYNANSANQFWAPRLEQFVTVDAAGTYYLVYDVQYDITDESAEEKDRMFMLEETGKTEDCLTLKNGVKTTAVYAIKANAGEEKKIRILPGPAGSVLVNEEIPKHTITISNIVMVSEKDYWDNFATKEEQDVHYQEVFDAGLAAATKDVKAFYELVSTMVDDYDAAIIAQIRNGKSFDEAVYVAAPTNLPVPTYEGVQYRDGGSHGAKDVRFVYSIPRNTSLPINDIGVMVCSSAYSISDDEMTVDAQGGNVTNGKVTTLFESLTNVEEDENKYYFTIIATDIPSHWPSAGIGLKTRAYATLEGKNPVYTSITKVDNVKNDETDA